MFFFVYETKMCLEIFGCNHIVENLAIETQKFILYSLEILQFISLQDLPL